MSRKLAVLALVWLLGAPFAQGGPAQVILIRHAEKPDKGHDLSPRGLERAAALVPYFLRRPEVLQYGAPVAIYAQKSTKDNRSTRPVQTVKGLAQALGLEVIQYEHDDYARMAREITTNNNYDGKTVLICWEHKLLHDIARELGVKHPPEYPNRFDRTWIISFPADQKPSLRDLPQRLMYGDSER